MPKRTTIKTSKPDGGVQIAEREQDAEHRRELALRSAREGPLYDAAVLQDLREKLWDRLKAPGKLDVTEVRALAKMILDGRRQAAAEKQAAEQAAEMKPEQEQQALGQVQGQLYGQPPEPSPA